MRIFHLTNTLSAGGLQRQISYLAPQQIKMGHDVHVVYSKNDFFLKHLINNGVTVHRVYGNKIFKVFWFFQLIRLFRKYPPSIVQTWYRDMDITGGIICRIYNIPWLVREPNSRLNWPDSIRNNIRILICNKSDAIVSNSSSGREYWLGKGYMKNLYVIRNALLFKKISQADVNTVDVGIRQTERYILYVGRLQKTQKNIKMILDVFIRIVNEKDVKAVIVGDGPEKDLIERIISQKGLTGKIIITGNLPEQEVWSLMKKALAFISLSKYEGCPNSVLEALSCSCPLILSDIPQHRDFLDDSLVWFVDLKSFRNIISMVNLVLKNSKDVKLKVIKGRQFAAKWSSVRENELEYEFVYSKILKYKKYYISP
jgi:glycosyltransferase involved in cell wall biosynthesis